MDQGSLLDLIAATLRLPAGEIGEESMMQNTPRWDSLRHVLLMTRIEASYGVSLTDAELINATSVASIRHILHAYGIDQPGSAR